MELEELLLAEPDELFVLPDLTVLLLEVWPVDLVDTERVDVPEETELREGATELWVLVLVVPLLPDLEVFISITGRLLPGWFTAELFDLTLLPWPVTTCLWLLLLERFELTLPLPLLTLFVLPGLRLLLFPLFT